MKTRRFAVLRMPELIGEARRAAAAVVGGEDPEGIHDLRVALRRLRAVTRTFKPLSGAGPLMRLRDDLRALGNLTNPIRDAEVRLELLREFADDVHAPEWVRTLEEERREIAARCTAFAISLEQEPIEPLLEAIEGALGGLESRPARTFARRRYRRERERVRDHVQAVTDAPEDLERLHRLRIAAKRLRYVSEFYSPLLTNRATRTGQRARRLQSVLGDLRDLDLLAEEIGRAPVRYGTMPAVNRARLTIRREAVREEAATAMQALADRVHVDEPAPLVG